MSGIYIHIPFCKQACHYCDFHFSTNTSKQNEMVEAICKEIELQKAYLADEVETIYFGGGTPSLLTQKQLSTILEKVHSTFAVSGTPEITLEANPDDLRDFATVEGLKKSGINRLSIGIQSFNESHLNYLNRAHTSSEARSSVELAQKAGIDNITIDLIYGIPSDSHEIWESDLHKALALEVPHISAYCLTIEEKTVFGSWLKKGKIKAVDDEFAAQQFETLLDKLSAYGYEQYEISNFARPPKYSEHNRNYWRQIPYLGIGPGAHSFNGKSRQFNIRNNALYLKALVKGTLPFDKEDLTRVDFINEYLMTSLRTLDGCDINYLKEIHDYDLETDQSTHIKPMIENGMMWKENSYLKLTTKGKLLADEIAADLFLVEG